MKTFMNSCLDQDKYGIITVDDCDYVVRNDDESIKMTAVKSVMMYASIEEVFKLFFNNIPSISVNMAYIRVLEDNKRNGKYLSTIFYWQEDIPGQENEFGVFTTFVLNDYEFDTEENKDDEFYLGKLKEMIKAIVDRIANYSYRIEKRENEIKLDDNLYTLAAADALKECKALDWSLDMIRDSYYHYTLKGDR